MSNNGTNKPRKLVVVGGVAGGASCAARARRLDEQAEIVVFEKGHDPSFANCGMPYYLGGEIKDRSALNVQTEGSLKARLNLTVHCLTEVTKVNREAKTVSVKEYTTGKEYDEPYDDLVLSVGAAPFKPPIPGIERDGNISLRNLNDMDKIHDWINSTGGKRAVVAGAGFIGVEMAEQLKHRGMEVWLVEAMPQIMAPLDEEMAKLLHAELEAKGVHVFVDDGINSFVPPTDGAKGSDVNLKSGVTLHADVVILGLGVRPDTKLAAEAGLKLGARGGIIVDSEMRTETDPHVWAVGDAIEVLNPTFGDQWMVAMAGPANRQGRMAADNIMGQGRKYRGTYGTSVMRCFDLTCACTGVNERTVKARGVPYKAIHVYPKNHAGYYPGSKAIWLKLVFNPETGAIYGAQSVGADLVEKRIDVIATAMYGKLTVDDLAQLELCYAPPFGTAKDPVNYAGMVAQDIMEGLVDTCTWDQVPELLKRPDVAMVDVRTPKEVTGSGKVHASAVNIEIDALRGRVAEIPQGKTLLVHCGTGLRSYYACRILNQLGFKTINLCGGYEMWKVLGLTKLAAEMSAIDKQQG
eukprot:CAMPEP_0173383216 /NCGR_PEP_ID=MMETSP1356-20130122/5757_1 /TAXON_ID=77927 ORGANISM="Hemiselmis virescens, Strain PCC157" /NCGR_SAMPLE_ID=MMETSP1356 /ASSEMBLY_ACC=CAM_ASM_000847 /LENGTH=578 /DNA_ID=CAMNT_0014337965 /DNA_START=206 /DNA_END=1942 /DNA_ORIENTATION=-